MPIRYPGEAPAQKLHALKEHFFTPATRETRISRSLAALKTASKLRLTQDQWKMAAENPEFEEES